MKTDKPSNRFTRRQFLDQGTVEKPGSTRTISDTSATQRFVFLDGHNEKRQLRPNDLPITSFTPLHR